MSTFGMTRMGGMKRDAWQENSPVIPMPLSVIPRLDRGIYAFMPKKWIPDQVGNDGEDVFRIKCGMTKRECGMKEMRMTRR